MKSTALLLLAQAVGHSVAFSTALDSRLGATSSALALHSKRGSAKPNGRTALHGHVHDLQWWPMRELTEDRAMLVLVRHGQSEWNFANRFIGWYDSPLTQEGEWEASEAGRLLKDHNIEVDEVHTSMLSRTLSTARLALKEMRDAGLRVPADNELRSTWRLNERSYGALTGRNKKECTKEYGKEQLKLWRRSWDIPPPQYEGDCEIYQEETQAFLNKVELLSEMGLFNPEADPPPAELPRGESLKCTHERVLPYWENTLLPALQQGKRVMVVGHENNLRALVKHLDAISNSDILEVDIPRAMPMVYMFEKGQLIKHQDGSRLQPIKLTPEDAAEGSEHLSARYLVDTSLIKALHDRDVMNVYDTTVEENLEEVCIIDENSDMCQVIGEYLHDPSEVLPDVPMIGEPVMVSRRETSAPAKDAAFLLPVSRIKNKATAVRLQSPAAIQKVWLDGVRPKSCTNCMCGSSPASRLGSTTGSSLCALLMAAATFLGLSRRRGGKRAAVHRAAEATATQIATDLGSNVKVEELDSQPHYFPTENLHKIFNLTDEIEEGEIGGAEAEICELIGYDMGESIDREIGKAFTQEELNEAYKRSGFYDAKPSDRPAAVWLIGPSACGKSTLAPLSADWVGMQSDKYVTIDGEYFRDCHHGYQYALTAGQQRGCVWWGAYVGIRENINLEKQKLLQLAVQDRKHLMIPSTCLRKSQCVDVVQMLRASGYEIHVVGVFGDKEEIVQRGRSRAMQKGKRYDPREYEIALTRFAPMLRLCTGFFRMVCTTGGSPFTTIDEGHAPITENKIESVCKKVFSLLNKA